MYQFWWRKSEYGDKLSPVHRARFPSHRTAGCVSSKDEILAANRRRGLEVRMTWQMPIQEMVIWLPESLFHTRRCSLRVTIERYD